MNPEALRIRRGAKRARQEEERACRAAEEERRRARWVEEARRNVARSQANHAARVGCIPAPTECEACGADIRDDPDRDRRHAKPPYVLHHHDYAKPLDVISLCGSCHGRVHGGSIPEPRTGRMYPVRAPGKWVEHEQLPGLLEQAVAEMVGECDRGPYDPARAAMRARAERMGLVVRLGRWPRDGYRRAELTIDDALARMRVPLAERAP